MGLLCESSFENFEPNMEWKHEDQVDILVLHLPGFKKRQLKVQVTLSGDLRITGDRRIKCNKRYRFVKELPISSNTDTNKITASFHDGKLYVKLPKLIVPQEKIQQQSSRSAPNRGNDSKPEGISGIPTDSQKNSRPDGVESGKIGWRKSRSRSGKPEDIAESSAGMPADKQKSFKPDGVASSKPGSQKSFRKTQTPKDVLEGKSNGLEPSTSGPQKSLGKTQNPEDVAEGIPDKKKSLKPDDVESNKFGSQKSFRKIGKPEDMAEGVSLKPDDINRTKKPEDIGDSSLEPADTGVTETRSGILGGNGKPKTGKLKEVFNGVIMELKKPENGVKIRAMLVLLVLGLGLYSMKKSFRSIANLNYIFRCQESKKDWCGFDVKKV